MDDVVKNTIDSHGGTICLVEAINAQVGKRWKVDRTHVKRWLKVGHFPKWLYHKTNGILPTEAPPIPPKKYSENFELIWSLRPKRSGSDPKPKAYINYNQHIQHNGYRHEDLLAGVQRYRNYCDAHYPAGRRQFIMQLCTFFSVAEDEPHFMKSWAVEKELSKGDLRLKKIQDKYR